MVICDMRQTEGAPDACAVDLAKARADDDVSECEDEDDERAGVLCNDHMTSMAIELVEGGDGEKQVDRE